MHSCLEERNNLCIIAFVYWRTKQLMYYCIRVLKNETTYALLHSCIEERNNLCIIVFVYWRTKQPMYYCIRVLKNEITYVLLHSCIEERNIYYCNWWHQSTHVYQHMWLRWIMSVIMHCYMTKVQIVHRFTSTYNYPITAAICTHYCK